MIFIIFPHWLFSFQPLSYFPLLPIKCIPLLRANHLELNHQLGSSSKRKTNSPSLDSHWLPKVHSLGLEPWKTAHFHLSIPIGVFVV